MRNPTASAVAACLLVTATACMGSDGSAEPQERPRTATKPDRCQTLGAWSTWPEADWVRSIAEAGGYNVFSETPSALVASSEQHEFYIWAAESDGKVDPVWRRLAKVRGVPIYGDRDLWRTWTAQGFTFWVHGTGVPAAGRLAPVVDASLRIPFRDPCGA